MTRHFARTVGLLLVSSLSVVAAATSSAQADSPQDPWYLETLRADDIWEQARGEGVTVAVIDSGVDDSVSELEGQVLEGTDLTLSPDGAHIDETGHGTSMAALIAGTGLGDGIQGLAPGVQILPIRVTAKDGVIDFGYEQRMADAIEYAVAEGAQIISISQASQVAGASREEVEDALAEAARQDVLIFAASGNRGDIDNSAEFPSKLDGVIGVGAVDSTGAREDYSTRGPHVALAGPASDAPGHCEWPDHEVCLMSGGTSSATALASASAALIRSAHPDWTKNQVLRVMMETADGPANGERNDEIGYGMVRPDRVILHGEGDPGDPDTNPLFASFEATLDPPPTPDPTEEEASVPTSAPNPDGEPTADPSASPATDNPAAAEASSDSNSGAFILFGLAAAVLAAGVLTALILHRRSTTRL
ncbi:S8 family serine peptidase [Streptomyces sp. 6N223]|uniref:S8 family serine peptidase n=1 Tax=Streptomyces sp. 6N223 TaxID=3457412 RepID=UPI003FD0A882